MNVKSGERGLTLFCHKTNSNILKRWVDNTKTEMGCENENGKMAKNCV